MEDIYKALEEEKTQEQKIKKAMEDSLLSVLQDESKTAEQKQELLQKSIHEFYSTVYDFAKEADILNDTCFKIHVFSLHTFF